MPYHINWSLMTARYHHFFSHKTQNIYPLLQLLIGLAIDVGLHQDKNRKPETAPEQQRERDRALLGCHFLSSTWVCLDCV
jgi:hypothetical protein